MFGAWIAVSFIAALVGGGELISRYRDAPGNALRTIPSLIYVSINILASLFAFGMLRVFHVDIGIDPVKEPDVLIWTQVLVAGFGAIALFRTSLFTMRVGDKDVGIGPSSFLQVILSAADRSVDRGRARERAAGDHSKLSYAKARLALPTYCLALMQNLPNDDQQLLARSLKALEEADIEHGIKLRILLLQLTNVVGPDVVSAAITALGSEIELENNP